jgi:nicotinamidase-related amidase
MRRSADRQPNTGNAFQWSKTGIFDRQPEALPYGDRQDTIEFIEGNMSLFSRNFDLPAARPWMNVVDYLSASVLLHLITLMELGLIIAAATLIEKPSAYVPAILILLLYLIFTQLDARSRYQEFKKVRDQLIRYGPNRRIFQSIRHSRCQRDAALAAARQVGHHRACRDFFWQAGYRWHHLLPHFLRRQPGYLFSPAFLRTTFFVPAYRSRYECAEDRFTAPEYERAALITIDVQNDTLDGGPFEVPGTSGVLPAIAGLCRAFRKTGRPIVHIMRIYTPDGENADLCRKSALKAGSPLLLKGSPGRRPADALLPAPNIRIDDDRLMAGKIQPIGPNEVLIYKPRWGAFYHTPLETHLTEKGVSTVVFCGCNYPNCPRTSIYQASERDFRIVAASDAISGIQKGDIDGLEKISVRCLSAEDIRRKLIAASNQAPRFFKMPNTFQGRPGVKNRELD